MALTAIPNNTIPIATISRSVTPTVISFESAGMAIVDFHATINAAIRLLKRITYTPEFAGGVWKIAVREYEYPASYNVAYVPTNLGTATAAPFTILLGTQIGQTSYTNNQVMLPTIFAAAGDTLLT